MNDLLLVDILQGTDNLITIAFGLYFGYSFPSLDEFIEGLVGTDLQQDVYVFRIFKRVLEANDVRGFEVFMDFDL